MPEPSNTNAKPSKQPRNRWHTLVKTAAIPGRKYGDIEKLELERLIGKMLKSTKTPVQYKSALASSLATLKGWNKYQDDNKSIDISTYLRRWQAENIYAAGSAANMLAAGSSIATNSTNSTTTTTTGYTEPAGSIVDGGIPKGGADGSASILLQNTAAIKNSTVTTDSKEVRGKEEKERDNTPQELEV